MLRPSGAISLKALRQHLEACLGASLANMRSEIRRYAELAVGPCGRPHGRTHAAVEDPYDSCSLEVCNPYEGQWEPGYVVSGAYRSCGRRLFTDLHDLDNYNLPNQRMVASELERLAHVNFQDLHCDSLDWNTLCTEGSLVQPAIYGCGWLLFTQLQDSVDCSAKWPWTWEQLDRYHTRLAAWQETVMDETLSIKGEDEVCRRDSVMQDGGVTDTVHQQGMLFQDKGAVEETKPLPMGAVQETRANNGDVPDHEVADVFLNVDVYHFDPGGAFTCEEVLCTHEGKCVELFGSKLTTFDAAGSVKEGMFQMEAMIGKISPCM